MARRLVGADVPNQLGMLFTLGRAGDYSDAHLVQRYLTARDGADQAAFTALVEPPRTNGQRVCLSRFSATPMMPRTLFKRRSWYWPARPAHCVTPIPWRVGFMVSRFGLP